MKYKNIILITLLLIALTIGVGSVSASQDNATVDELTVNEDMDVESSVIDEVVAEDSDNYLSSNGSLIILNGGTFEDIQKAVDESSDEDVIELHGTFESTGMSISVYKNLTFNGVNGTILDGKNLSGFFNSDQHLMLNGLTFINSSNEVNYHSFILNNSEIVNCNFINCNPFSAHNSCNFINCSFYDSSIILGAGNVFNCSFYDSEGINGAGDVINCSFINCWSAFYGVIYGANDILNCKFINNSVESGSGVSNVGSVINCLFKEYA